MSFCCCFHKHLLLPSFLISAIRYWIVGMGFVWRTRPKGVVYWTLFGSYCSIIGEKLLILSWLKWTPIFDHTVWAAVILLGWRSVVVRDKLQGSVCAFLSSFWVAQCKRLFGSDKLQYQPFLDQSEYCPANRKLTLACK